MSEDCIEFYSEGSLVVRVESSIIPLIGNFINIKKVTYVIKNIAFAVDYAESLSPKMRCNIDLSKA